MATRRKTDTVTGKLFAEPQSDMFVESEEERVKRQGAKKIECLGMTFDSDVQRREYFLGRLKEKLEEPEFRRTSGFPQATDEAILRLSDPPYYTACPNPFLEEFVKTTDRDRSKDPPYHREPFAVDVSEGKTDSLYRAHSYHTKVPHLAIVPSILHYTEPGDLVLDGFCGSGMTGVAAQFCGAAPAKYKQELKARWKEHGYSAPRWGVRRSVQGDLSPAAAFIAANYNLPFDVNAFFKEAERILAELDVELGWTYETLHADGVTKGRINYTVWSEVFTCPDCAGEVVFVEDALDPDTKRIHESFPCRSCGAELTRRKLERLYEARPDPVTGNPFRAPKRIPVFINYNVGKERYEKPLDDNDHEVLAAVGALPLPAELPVTEIPYMHMTHERARMDNSGVTHLHHFFLPRASQSLGFMWQRAQKIEDTRVRNMLLFFFEQSIWGLSILNRYKTIMHGRPTSSNVNQYLSGVYYVPSQHSEVSPWYNLANRLKRLRTKAFIRPVAISDTAAVGVTDCAVSLMPECSVDYVFTDPPFGENIYYADLNYLVESWHGVLTAAETEAIVDKAKDKGLHEYQGLMQACFQEYYRVLKPGRWMTVVFSNSSNAVWRAIQEAIGAAGFVVADVRTLDKKQGSYRQVTSSAVKQDLVISAYKPTVEIEDHFQLGGGSEEGCWEFISEHMKNLPVALTNVDEMEVLAERTPQMLQDRMIAFHVQRGLVVPVSTAEFLTGLAQRYVHRDGMYFLTEQSPEYDKKRIRMQRLRQLNLFVNDEATAIQWLRQELGQKPKSFQDLQPRFMRELKAWAKHERTIELRDILHENFLKYDGNGPVPSQIKSYLSTNFRDYRKLDRNDPTLRAKAAERWYVPDPGKVGDLEALRARRLMAEFEEYNSSKEKKLRLFRTEAIRAGFKAAWDRQDYETIVAIGGKLPEKVLQEDEKLLMYYDAASMRLGT